MMNMDGDDAQLVDSILREYGSAPQPPVTDLRTSINVPTNFDNNIDMNIQATPINTQNIQNNTQNKVDVSFKQPSSMWNNFKLPILVLVICFVVFNPYLYHYLLKFLPSIFAANTAMKMQLRVVILSLVVAILFSLTTKYI
jgi:hypothetical protein